jgi:hypothetical protein
MFKQLMTKYYLIFQDSVGEEFVFLRIKTTKETKTKFAKLSNLRLPSPDYDYQLYSKDESGKF